MTAVLVPDVLTAAPVEEDLGLVELGSYRALGHHFDLQVSPDVDSPDVLERLVAPFRDCQRGGTQRSRYTLMYDEATDRYILHFDGERFASGARPADLVAPFAWHLNRAVIDASVARFHLMHASAVTRAGVTVVLPADMESGKTTTAAGLLREGYGYVTDEAAAVDPETGRVHPFPKRLSLDPGSWPLFPDLASKYGASASKQWQITPGDLGAVAATGPVAAPSVIAFPKYVAGSRTEVLPLGMAEATYELARMTFHFSQAPGRNLRSAARLAAGATVVRLRIGNLEDAVSAVEGLVSERLLEAW